MTPAGTSNELDLQNEWEENTHTHTHTAHSDRRPRPPPPPPKCSRAHGCLNTLTSSYFESTAVRSHRMVAWSLALCPDDAKQKYRRCLVEKTTVRLRSTVRVSFTVCQRSTA